VNLNMTELARQRLDLDMAGAIDESVRHFNIGYIEPGDGTRYMVAFNHLTLEQSKAWGGGTDQVAHFIFDKAEGWRGQAPRQMFAYSGLNRAMTIKAYRRFMGEDDMWVSTVGYIAWCFITGQLEELHRQITTTDELLEVTIGDNIDPWTCQLHRLLSHGTIDPGWRDMYIYTRF
jgi:hypothetical protein